MSCACRALASISSVLVLTSVAWVATLRTTSMILASKALASSCVAPFTRASDCRSLACM
jgi:hypothetical protein